MTDDRTATRLLDHAVGGLQPDLDALVAGAVRRGRARRRRSRVAGASAAAVTTLVLASGAVVLAPQADRGHDALSGQPTTGPLTTGPAQPRASRHRTPAVAPADMATTLAGLLPAGSTSALATWSEEKIARPSYQGGRLVYRGAQVLVFLRDRTRDTAPGDAPVGSARAECRQAAQLGGSCTALGGGDWRVTHQREETHRNRPTGTLSNEVHLLTRDGYDITAQAYNAPAEKNREPVSATPVLSLEQLAALTDADFWLR